MAQPIDIQPFVLPVSLGFGGLGLYTLLPWRGGNTGWIGVGLLCCCLAGVSVHLGNPGGETEPAGPSSIVVYGIGTLGVFAVAAAVACVVSPNLRWLLAGLGAVIGVSSLLVGIVAGWPVGTACLVINATVAARMWRRVAPDVVVPTVVGMENGVVPAPVSSDSAEGFTSTRERTLAVVAGTALAGAVLVWGLEPLAAPTRVAAVENSDRHGYLLVAGMLLIVLLAFIGSLTGEGNAAPEANSSPGETR